jgi:hypothetical protein
MGAPTITVTGQQADYRTVSVTMTPNNHGGNATCSLTVNGAVAQAPCDTAAITLSIGGLWPNNTYGFTVTITNPAGSVSANGSIATATIRFAHGCDPNSSMGSQCSGGVWAYRTPSQGGTAVSPSLKPGEGGIAECWAVGDATINAEPWGMRKDNRWIRFQDQGTAYFPYAWSNIDGGDLGNIPQC